MMRDLKVEELGHVYGAGGHGTCCRCKGRGKGRGKGGSSSSSSSSKGGYKDDSSSS